MLVHVLEVLVPGKDLGDAPSCEAVGTLHVPHAVEMILREPSCVFLHYFGRELNANVSQSLWLFIPL